jgi:1-deoxyxylulose-5-phosphate synthase
MQNFYNLLYREEEREMLPLCVDERIAVLPWSPLARGRLARPASMETPRTQTDKVFPLLFSKSGEADRKVIEEVGVVAETRGVPRAQVALAWLLHKSAVTAPIVGASTPEQLDDALASLSLELTDAEMRQLEAPYVPHPVVGHS